MAKGERGGGKADGNDALTSPPPSLEGGGGGGQEGVDGGGLGEVKGGKRNARTGVYIPDPEQYGLTGLAQPRGEERGGHAE